MKINHILKEYEYDPAEDSKAVDQYNMLKRQVGEMYAEAFWRMWRKTANVNAALRMTQEEYDRMVRYESVEEDTVNEKMYTVDAPGQPTQKFRDIRDADVKIFKLIKGVHDPRAKGEFKDHPAGPIKPENIVLKLDGVEVPHKYTGKEKQPITGPVIKEAMSDAYGIVSAEPEVEGSVEFKQHKNTDKGSVSIEAAGDTMQDLADVLKLAGLTLPKDMHNDQEASAHDDEPEQEDVLLSPDHKDDEEKSPCDSPDTDPSYETDKEILINYIKDKLKKSIS